MDKQLIISKAVELIKEFEGFKEYAYLCSANVWTYGYGFTRSPNGNKLQKYDRIKKNEADKYLEKILVNDLKELLKLVRVPLKEIQYSVLLSFCYNVGFTRFRRSTLLSNINKQLSEELIIKEFSRWVYASGQLIRGLKFRRQKESNLYFTKKIGKLDL